MGIDYVQPRLLDADLVSLVFIEEIPAWPGAQGPEQSLVREIGELRVRFSSDDQELRGRPIEITLAAPEGVRPTDLQRFAWKRWLTVARAFHAAPSEPHPAGGGWSDAMWVAIDAAHGPAMTHPRRPGRGGHPEGFYERIAARYRALEMSGEPHPTKRIAEQDQYSPHTVSGWIRRCRKLGMLPESRSRIPSKPKNDSDQPSTS